MLWITLIIILIIVIWGGITNWKFINKNIQYFSNKHTINNVFNKVYVINLDREPKKLSIINNQLKKYDIKYSRFKAIDGKNVIDNYDLPEHSWNFENPGALGCLLSHREVIKDALLQNYDRILVLEDDCLFTHDFTNHFNTKYNSILEFNPNWKLLYFGCSHQFGWPNEIEYHENFYLPKEGYATFAIGIDKTIMKDILKFSDDFQNPIVDIFVNHFQKNNSCLAFYPHIIQQNISFISNITEISQNLEEYLEENKVKLKDFL